MNVVYYGGKVRIYRDGFYFLAYRILVGAILGWFLLYSHINNVDCMYVP